MSDDVWIAIDEEHVGLWLTSQPCPEAAKEYGITWIRGQYQPYPTQPPKPVKTAAEQKAQDAGNQIGKAVANLNPALVNSQRGGFNAWRP